MDPLAIVIACWAAFYIFFRGPLLVAPEAWVGFERRLMYATTGRLRIFGGAMLVLLAAPLVVTARQTQGSIAFWAEGFGWFAAASMVWFIAAPGPWKRFLESLWDLLSDPPLLRAMGALGLAFGLFLGWVALFAL